MENNLIKKHNPKYNILLKDDKTYPYIKVTTNEMFPRVFVTRKLLKDKNVKFKFLFAGDGELNSDLIKLRNQLGLEEVEFKGFMDNCDELYKNLDIFILSSIFEGSSNSLIEAMSFKDAVIVSDIQSNLEIIDNGRYGISFKVGSPEDLFEKLFDVINNKEKLLELKEKALEGVKKNYNYNVNMKNFENQLNEVHAKINGK